jgi:hypothetical protein
MGFMGKKLDIVVHFLFVHLRVIGRVGRVVNLIGIG